jgi:[CysO sulfur-carrier protein]-S-L-cysteine hydrolase
MIKLPQKILDTIITQAKDEAPDEACGYLAGTGKTAELRIPMTNVDHSPEHFSFDPAEQFAAVKQVREAGLELFAVYHSHPETPARMSDEDIRLANDPNTAYIITSLADGKTKAFSIDLKKTVSELPLEIV